MAFSYEDVKSSFDSFWESTGAFANTSMYGLADIWEGPPYTMSGNNAVLAIDTYKDYVFTLHGGGIKTWLKVVGPDGPRIYEIGPYMIWTSKVANPPYFNLAVINEDEVIAGYMYLNLKHQFMAPYGLNLAGFWQNPTVNISNVRVSSSSWITMIRQPNGWDGLVFQKSSPMDCIPCAGKKRLSKREFECEDISYSRGALRMPGYKANGLSVTTSGLGDRLPTPRLNPEECARSMSMYSVAFNSAKISPSDIGIIGQAISDNCSSSVYTTMVDVAEYQQGSEVMKEDYIKELMEGNNNLSNLLSESTRLTGLIGGYLSNITNVLGENQFTIHLFRDTVWWAPIWFAANAARVMALANEEVLLSAYSLLRGVDLVEDFVPMLRAASSGIGSHSASPSSMGWKLVGKKGSALAKYSKHNATYFSFPKSQCFGVRSIGTICGKLEIDGVCDVETRGNGILIWGWKFFNGGGTLHCFLVSNDGVVSRMGTAPSGDNFSPVSGAAMSVSDGGSQWFIRDFYLASPGDIKFTEVSISSGGEMERLKNTTLVSNYANINEITGSWGSSSANYYGDGLLDQKPGRLSLGQVDLSQSWGEGTKQFTFVDGFTSFIIRDDNDAF